MLVHPEMEPSDVEHIGELLTNISIVTLKAFWERVRATPTTDRNIIGMLEEKRCIEVENLKILAKLL